MYEAFFQGPLVGGFVDVLGFSSRCSVVGVALGGSGYTSSGELLKPALKWSKYDGKPEPVAL